MLVALGESLRAGRNENRATRVVAIDPGIEVRGKEDKAPFNARNASAARIAFTIFRDYYVRNGQRLGGTTCAGEHESASLLVVEVDSYLGCHRHAGFFLLSSSGTLFGLLNACCSISQSSSVGKSGNSKLDAPARFELGFGEVVFDGFLEVLE